MLLIEYVGHIGLRSLTDGHPGHHLEYFKTLNDARVASVGFIKYNASTTRINKEKNFKIKFHVIHGFYWTISTKRYIRPVVLFDQMSYSTKCLSTNCRGSVSNCVLRAILISEALDGEIGLS